MAKPFLEPGPVPGTVINSPGELDALIASGQPGEDHGMTYRAATAPDIATYPIYANFIWIDTSGARPIKRTYNTSLFTWDAELPADGSITGAMLADNTITLDKIYATSGLGGYVLRLNSLSNTVVWDAPANLFSANTFTIANLTYSGAGTYVLSSNGSANSWATIASLLATGDIALANISTSGALSNQVIYYNGSALAYGYPDQLLRTNEVGLNALELGAGNSFPSVNALGTAWEFKTIGQIYALLAPSIGETASSPQAIPSNGGQVTINHGLGSTPRRVRWVLVNVTPEFGYTAGMEIDIQQLLESNADNEYGSFATAADTTQLVATRSNIGASTLVTTRLDTGAACALTSGSWQIKVYYSL